MGLAALIVDSLKRREDLSGPPRFEGRCELGNILGSDLLFLLALRRSLCFM